MRASISIHLVVLAALSWLSATAFSTASAAPVQVILWFDTEDYLLPADDDACLRLAEMLTKRHIPATFKIVGEKARVLQQRGRHDVIGALKQHDISYHANFHSVHPTPSEYLADCGLLDGMAEFVRREGPGAADVREIFSVPTLGCYGQPGSSWAPQAIAALGTIGVAPHGIPCYVDEGNHVGLNEQPFWYCGALNVYHMGQNYTRMELHDPAAVEPAKRNLLAIAQRLGQQGGGLISIFYHPCEWVHREFWDGVNFRRGANPPREQWRPPPQLSAEETAGAFARFGQYLDYMLSLTNLEFVTASDLPLLYPDPIRSIGTPESDIQQVAAFLSAPDLHSVDFKLIGQRAYSVADQFELLTLAVAQMISGRSPQFPLVARGLLGPDAEPPGKIHRESLNWPAVRDTTLDVLSFVQKQGRIPSRVFLGSEPVGPLEFLQVLASVYEFRRSHDSFPATLSMPGSVELLPARQVAADTPQLFGDWVIHKEGFRAPQIVRQARLQSWTLKPAIRKEP